MGAGQHLNALSCESPSRWQHTNGPNRRATSVEPCNPTQSDPQPVADLGPSAPPPGLGALNMMLVQFGMLVKPAGKLGVWHVVSNRGKGWPRLSD